MKDFKMPSPADLAKKDETVNISLRIKKSAVDIFDMLAKEQKSKSGTMMVSLIEGYADTYRKQNQGNDEDMMSAKIIDAHLDKLADKVGKMDESDMLIKMSHSPSLMKRLLDENYDIKNIGSLESILNILNKVGNEEINQYPMITFGNQEYYSAEVICTYGDKKPALEEFEHMKGDVYEDSIYLPPKKWLATIIMLSEYEGKMNTTMPQWTVLLTEEMGQDIAKLAKTENDNAKYAHGLARILSGFVMKQIEKEERHEQL